MVVRLATKSVYGGFESAGVSQEWAPKGAISAVLVLTSRPPVVTNFRRCCHGVLKLMGAVRMKIVSHWQRRAGRVYDWRGF